MLTLRVTAVVASRQTERISLAGRPDNSHLPLIPDGLCHAVMLGEGTTVCGLSTVGLTVFPGLGFADASFLHCCDSCALRLGLPS